MVSLERELVEGRFAHRSPCLVLHASRRGAAWCCTLADDTANLGVEERTLREEIDELKAKIESQRRSRESTSELEHLLDLTKVLHKYTAQLLRDKASGAPVATRSDSDSAGSDSESSVDSDDDAPVAFRVVKSGPKRPRAGNGYMLFVKEQVGSQSLRKDLPSMCNLWSG
jgi:hypothetical protein